MSIKTALATEDSYVITFKYNPTLMVFDEIFTSEKAAIDRIADKRNEFKSSLTFETLSNFMKISNDDSYNRGFNDGKND